MRLYRLTRRAQRDFREIEDFLERNSPAMVERIIQALHSKCTDLGETPGMGRARSELGAGIHSFTVAPFLIFYRKSKTGIEVLRVLHGARDIESEFQ